MQSTASQGSWQKQWSLLVANAWADENLKQQLIDDPATVLREHGIDVPYDMELRVVEDTSQVRHLILPANPSDDLTDEELSASIGADSFSGFSGRCGRCGCGRCACDRV